MGYLELRLDTSEGKIRKGSVRDVPSPQSVPVDHYEWKVIRDEADGVTVHTVVDGAVAEVGSARWSAHALVDRQPKRGPLGEHEWALIQLALQRNPQPKKQKASKAQARSEAIARAEANGRSAAYAESVAEAKAPPKGNRWLNGPLALAGIAAAAAVVVFLLRGTGIPLWIPLTLGGLAIALAVYSLAGADSQCPKCDAWFHRKRLRRDQRGTEDSTRTESVKSPVYGTDRKVTGYTYTDRTVDIRIRNWTDSYECTKCQHPWSVDYQSTSRR